METNEKKSVAKEKKTNNVIHIVSISLSAVAIVLSIVAIGSNVRLSRQCKMPGIPRYQYAQYNQYGKNRPSRNGMHRSMMRNNGSNRNNAPMQQNKNNNNSNNNNFGRNRQTNPGNNNNFNWEQFGNFNRNNRSTIQDGKRNESRTENRNENNAESKTENNFPNIMPQGILPNNDNNFSMTP